MADELGAMSRSSGRAQRKRAATKAACRMHVGIFCVGSRKRSVAPLKPRDQTRDQGGERGLRRCDGPEFDSGSSALGGAETQWTALAHRTQVAADPGANGERGIEQKLREMSAQYEARLVPTAPPHPADCACQLLLEVPKADRIPIADGFIG